MKHLSDDDSEDDFVAAKCRPKAKPLKKKSSKKVDKPEDEVRVAVV